MPSIAITLVTAATDTITAVGHGLVTGDRMRLRNTGGALPAATPALTGATDFWAVRLDADNFKVAVSNANAMAGTPVVDITGVGTGTHYVEYGLPYCIPNQIAANGTQILPADFNGTWNALVALHAMITGQAQTIWTPFRTIIVPVSAPANGVVNAMAATVTGTVGLGPAFWTAQIPGLSVGERILAVRARVKDSATGPTKLTISLQQAADGVLGAVVTSGQSTGSGLAQPLSVSAAVDVASGIIHLVYVAIVTGSASCSIYQVEVDVGVAL